MSRGGRQALYIHTPTFLCKTPKKPKNPKLVEIPILGLVFLGLNPPPPHK